MNIEEGTYINLNGKYYYKDSASLLSNNRAFLYGDGIFETVHANGTKIQFFQDHYERMIKGMKLLKMNIDHKFEKNILLNNLIGLLNKNKYYKGARVRLTIFRNSGGLYTPSNNEASYLIDSTPLVNDKYSLNQKGLTIEIFDKIKKPINEISKLKTINALIFILAGLHKIEKKIDDCLIINEENKIIESISSNIFIVKENKIYTPSVENGCVEGVMQKQIIKTALKLGYTIFEDCSITENDLLDADEIFLTNAIVGIQWVVAYKQRRYFNTIAKKLITDLNKTTFNS